jgi:hypothetical protein
MASTTPRPRLLIFADAAQSEAVLGLFGTRGFDITSVSTLGALDLYLLSHDVQALSVVITDFRHAGAHAALTHIKMCAAKPAIVGIGGDPPGDDSQVDAWFAWPVEPARLFVRVVELVNLRRKGHLSKKLTGIVGVVRGNDLFHSAVSALCSAISPVNAGAILEAHLRDVGASPASVGPDDVKRLLANGALADSLSAFGHPVTVRRALSQVSRLSEQGATRR